METVKLISNTILSILTIGYFIIQLNKNLQYYQQSHYHFPSFKKYFVKYYYSINGIFLGIFVISLFFIRLWYIQIIVSIFIIYLISKELKIKSIKKLAFTSRIMRFYVVETIFLSALGTYLFIWFSFQVFASVFTIYVILCPLMTLIGALIAYPIEYLICLYYQKKATTKINKINPKVISVTGSFGKTSTKDILFQILSQKYRTLKTPNSFNTINGISKTINNELRVTDQYFVVEMGCSHKGDIDHLLKIAKPNYGIVTGIGASHLESFKSMENIIREKMKLIESLPEDGIGFINIDNEYIKNYRLTSKAKIVTFGFNSDDYRIIDYQCYFNKTVFEVLHNNIVYQIETNLLGKHNIYNLCATFAVACELGIDENTIIDHFKMLKVTPHRLEVKSVDNRIIIDDAYNSNLIGFQNALEILNLYDGQKVVITPGIVETGKNEIVENEEIATIIKEVCDSCYIINSKTGNIIYNKLLSLGFDKVVLCNSFKDAYQLTNENECILIENDLLDYYFI